MSDLGDSYADLRRFASEAATALGGAVDILVNKTGIYPAAPTTELTDDDLDQMLAVNVRAPTSWSPNSSRRWSSGAAE